MQASSGQMTAPQLQTLLSAGALAGAWALDPGKSSIRLKSGVMGRLIPVNGVFREISGDGTVSPDGEISGTLTVAAASIDTKKPKRDKHLRSADFFDTGNHPEITFTAAGIRPSGEGVAVTGTLTVHGRTRPLSFAAEAASTFFIRCPSTNGPFLIERAIASPYAFLWRLRTISAAFLGVNCRMLRAWSTFLPRIRSATRRPLSTERRTPRRTALVSVAMSWFLYFFATFLSAG